MLTNLDQKILKIGAIIEEKNDSYENILKLYELNNYLINMKNYIISVFYFIVQAKSNMDQFHFTMEACFLKILKYVENNCLNDSLTNLDFKEYNN